MQVTKPRAVREGRYAGRWLGRHVRCGLGQGFKKLPLKLRRKKFALEGAISFASLFRVLPQYEGECHANQ